MAITIKIKRAYEPFDKMDGFRVLVDRLWPRGVTKKDAHIDLWMKDIAPSIALRKWFNHEPEKWEAFSKSYRAELKKSGAVDELIEYATEKKTVTLIYAGKDEKHTHALVLLHYVTTLLK
jgi:uncharacterized protein YeaO (DUF488 family)